jgi:hypothetical protein
MSFGPGTQRILLLTAAGFFGVFFVIAFVFRRMDVSQDTLSIVGGVFAYVFIVAAAVILLRGWRRRGMDVQRPIAGFLADHPTVVGAVGHPVSVGSPAGQVPTGTGAPQPALGGAVGGAGARRRARAAGRPGPRGRRELARRFGAALGPFLGGRAV